MRVRIHQVQLGEDADRPPALGVDGAHELERYCRVRLSNLPKQIEREERAVTVGEGGGGNEELSEACEGDPKSRELRAELRTRVGGKKPEEICRRGGGVKAGTIQGRGGKGERGRGGITIVWHANYGNLRNIELGFPRDHRQLTPPEASVPQQSSAQAGDGVGTPHVVNNRPCSRRWRRQSSLIA